MTSEVSELIIVSLFQRVYLYSYTNSTFIGILILRLCLWLSTSNISSLFVQFDHSVIWVVVLEHSREAFVGKVLVNAGVEGSSLVSVRHDNGEDWLFNTNGEMSQQVSELTFCPT